MLFLDLLIYITILAFIIYVACKLLVMLIRQAVIYSKIALSLFIALVVHTSNPFVQVPGIVSYLIWTAIFSASLMVLSFLPRLNCALDFACTLIVSYLLATVVSGTVISTISLIYEFAFDPNALVFKLLLKAICAVITYRSLMAELDKGSLNYFKNPILKFLERAVAACIYGFALYFIVVDGLQYESEVWDYVILAASVMVPFIVDWLFTRE